MQISALEVWHVNNEENNSQMCSLESGSADFIILEASVNNKIING